MKVSSVIVLEEVKNDLLAGKIFYDSNEEGIGTYFYDSLLSDIESLQLFAGIHSKHYGFFRMMSKRFPFAIYYYIQRDTAIVVSVLDMRRNPAWIFKRIKNLRNS